MANGPKSDDLSEHPVDADVQVDAVDDASDGGQSPHTSSVRPPDTVDDGDDTMGDGAPIRGVMPMSQADGGGDGPVPTGSDAVASSNNLKDGLASGAKSMANGGMEAAAAATQVATQGVRALPGAIKNVVSRVTTPVGRVINRVGTRMAYMLGVPTGAANAGIAVLLVLATAFGGGALLGNTPFDIAVWSDYDDCLFDFSDPEQAFASYGKGENQIPEPYGSGGFTVTGYGEGGWHYTDGSTAAIAQGTNQRKVWERWRAAGSKYTEHIATIDGRYLVATTDTYGACGDSVDFFLDDGTRIPCILADVKSSGDSNWNKWGHDNNVLEFEVDIKHYLRTGNPGTNGWYEDEWGGKRVASWTNLGGASDGSIIGGAGSATNSASAANAVNGMDACQKRVTSADNSSAAAAMLSLCYSRSDVNGTKVNYGNGYEGTELWYKVYEEVIPEDSGVWPRSCDRGVCTAVRWSGTDIDFPAGPCSNIMSYLANSDKWELVGDSADMPEDEFEPGDVLIAPGHVKMYVGRELPAQIYENVLKGTDGDLGEPDPEVMCASASLGEPALGSDSRAPNYEAIINDSAGPYKVYRCVKPDNSDKFDSFDVAGMTSRNSASVAACECRVIPPAPKQEIGEEIAELAVEMAATAAPDERIEGPHDDPWCNSGKVGDPRLDNTYAIMDATLGAWGGNNAYASCTQASAAVIAAVADPDIGLSGPTNSSPDALKYMSEHPEIYEKDPSGDLKPGDILSSEHHTMIYVGTKAARKKFPDTNGEFYEASYYMDTGLCFFPGISDRDYDGFTVFRVKKKNTNAEHDTIDWRRIIKKTSASR